MPASLLVALGPQSDYKQHLMRADPLRVGWCAGLFDGEGCISMWPDKSGGRDRYRVMLRMAMTSHEAVNLFARTVGCGTVRRYRARPPRVPFTIWGTYGRESMIAVLRLLAPALVSKAHEAQLVERYLTLDLPERVQRNIYQEVLSLKCRIPYQNRRKEDRNRASAR